jgi:hypothetical protein
MISVNSRTPNTPYIELNHVGEPTYFLRANGYPPTCYKSFLGTETDIFLEHAAKLLKRKQTRARVEMLEKATQLLPLERPAEVFDLMQSFLSRVERAL